MTKTHAALAGPLTLGLIAIAFCIWSAFGNDINICVTTGCTLYEDASVFGVSLWWIGAAAFCALCACAILGQAAAGRWLAALFLLGDICLLLLMAFTAPCVSCLVIALIFALIYYLFRRAAPDSQRKGAPQPRASLLLWIWLALFVVNLGQVARSQLDVWPILDESGEPNLRMFFSPSCKYCIEGINALSGNINVAFYPLAENESDIARIDKMIILLDQGMNLAEALDQSKEAAFAGFWAAYNPDVLLLRFRLLRNKAHVFSQGSQGVPFFERKGLPPDIVAKANAAKSPVQLEAPQPAPVKGGDENLPAELSDSTQCDGQTPCPPAD